MYTAYPTPRVRAKVPLPLNYTKNISAFLQGPEIKLLWETTRGWKSHLSRYNHPSPPPNIKRHHQSTEVNTKILEILKFNSYGRLLARIIYLR
jgi:hypothetical protein